MLINWSPCCQNAWVEVSIKTMLIKERQTSNSLSPHRCQFSGLLQNHYHHPNQWDSSTSRRRHEHNRTNRLDRVWNFESAKLWYRIKSWVLKKTSTNVTTLITYCYSSIVLCIVSPLPLESTFNRVEIELKITFRAIFILLIRAFLYINNCHIYFVKGLTWLVNRYFTNTDVPLFRRW